MKILIGIDGSDGSLDAVRQVGRLANSTADQIVLWYAPPHIQFLERDSNQPEMIDQARRAMADAVFARAKSQLPPDLAPGSTTIVGEGSPRAGLVAAAKEVGADLLAVGARGVGPVKDARLGGVSRHVANAGASAVLVTRPRRHEGPLRVLLATDGSDGSRRAAAALARASWPSDTVGHVIRVMEPYFSQLPPWLEAEQKRDPAIEALSQGWVAEHDTDMAKAKSELSALAKTLPPAFQNQPPIVVEGHAAEQILRAINNYKIDLVVVGAQGKSAWQQFVLGSTSEEEFSAQAPCSVLLTPG